MASTQNSRPVEGTYCEGDPYSYYLTLWDSQESMQDRERTVVMTTQGVFLTVVLLFYESNPGLAIFLTLQSMLWLYVGFEQAMLRAKSIALLKWLIVEFESTGNYTRKIFTLLQDFGRRNCVFAGTNLKDNTLFTRLLSRTRSPEFAVYGGIGFLWLLLIHLMILPADEVRLFGAWVLSLIKG